MAHCFSSLRTFPTLTMWARSTNATTLEGKTKHDMLNKEDKGDKGDNGDTGYKGDYII